MGSFFDVKVANMCRYVQYAFFHTRAYHWRFNQFVVETMERPKRDTNRCTCQRSYSGRRAVQHCELGAGELEGAASLAISFCFVNRDISILSRLACNECRIQEYIGKRS